MSGLPRVTEALVCWQHPETAWQRQFGWPLKMFVKVSGRQIADPMFATKVADIVNRTGLRPKTLGLEVMESVLIHEA